MSAGWCSGGQVREARRGGGGAKTNQKDGGIEHGVLLVNPGGLDEAEPVRTQLYLLGRVLLIIVKGHITMGVSGNPSSKQRTTHNNHSATRTFLSAGMSGEPVMGGDEESGVDDRSSVAVARACWVGDDKPCWDGVVPCSTMAHGDVRGEPVGEAPCRATAWPPESTPGTASMRGGSWWEYLPHHLPIEAIIRKSPIVNLPLAP